MTTPWRGDTVNISQFGLWLRTLENPMDSRSISCHNLDYIWHNYKQNWMILIEEKTHNAPQTYAQKDTHLIVHQILQLGSQKPVQNAKGQTIIIDYRGYYLVQLSHLTPLDSRFIKINGVQYNRQLVNVIKHLLTNGTQPPLFTE